MIAAIGIILAALLWPSNGGPTVSNARRSRSQANLKNQALALHFHHEKHGSFPRATDQSAHAAEHGWQTYLLPFLDETPLSRSIDYDKPYDDPANAPHFGTRLDVYLIPGIEETHDPRGYALSHYAGNVRVLGRNPPMKFADITDGTVNTMLLGEINEGFLPWGDPRNFRDPARGINAGPGTFGGPTEKGANVAYADGSVGFLAEVTSPEVLKALASPDGGEFAGETKE